MKKYIPLAPAVFFLLLFSHPVFCQSKSLLKLEKTKIGDSGMSAYLPKGIVSPDVAISEDSSMVYTSEYADTVNHFYFAYIAVKLNEPLDDSFTRGEMEDFLITYLEFLKTEFEITESAGYGRGHTSEKNPGAYGIIDFWKDAEGTDVAIKGWVNKKCIMVMLVYGNGDYPVYNIQQMFFNGILMLK